MSYTISGCRKCKFWYYSQIKDSRGQCIVLSNFNDCTVNTARDFYCNKYKQKEVFNKRLGNLELKFNRDIKVNLPIVDRRLEIFVTELDGSEWLIAYWISDGNFWDLRFVNQRPFQDNINQDDFMELARIGQEYLKENDIQ